MHCFSGCQLFLPHKERKLHVPKISGLWSLLSPIKFPIPCSLDPITQYYSQYQPVWEVYLQSQLCLSGHLRVWLLHHPKDWSICSHYSPGSPWLHRGGWENEFCTASPTMVELEQECLPWAAAKHFKWQIPIIIIKKKKTLDNKIL